MFAIKQNQTIKVNLSLTQHLDLIITHATISNINVTDKQAYKNNSI